MKKVQLSLISAIVVAIFLCGYVYRDSIASLFYVSRACVSVIEYSVGELDYRFGIDREQVIEHLKQAERIWEEEADKDLFEYSEAGKLKVNLIYDYRQRATDNLTETGGTIDATRKNYDKVKSEYNALLVTYNNDKEKLNAQISRYNEEKNEYDEQVEHWNNNGGAPADTYEELEHERKSLNQKADDIVTDQNRLQITADKLNTLTDRINTIGDIINEYVAIYNDTVTSTGEEFSEGEYIRDGKGERINVYQFDDEGMLERLLSHEFGHALGIDHVDDEDALMYRLNKNTSNKLTTADLKAFTEVCY